MKKTKIQWCHSSINPVMGCEGCELWPGAGLVGDKIAAGLAELGQTPASQVMIKNAIDGRPFSAIYADRKNIATQIAGSAPNKARTAVVDSIRRTGKCYAGLLGTMRGGHKGYADQFEAPKCYPGRMAKAARWGLPTAKEIETKPWLASLPRLIFVSDMGDALSSSVPYDYLEQEIIENVNSPKGQRHIWLWVTKRPARMAEFAAWLSEQGIALPDNLVAMTTVTSQSKASRVDQLRKVPSRWKGLSVEPLFEAVKLDLSGINWVIVGGGSDVLAEPFHVEWALDLQQQCREAGAACFIKQLGKNPFYQGKPLPLVDKHGGDWTEWLPEWRVREMPAAFREYGQNAAPVGQAENENQKGN